MGKWRHIVFIIIVIVAGISKENKKAIYPVSRDLRDILTELSPPWPFSMTANAIVCRDWICF